MKYRPHKGSLDESMALMQEFNGFNELLAIIENELSSFEHNLNINDQSVKVEPYTPDNRTGWNTHIVTLEGYGVVGFTDCAVK